MSDGLEDVVAAHTVLSEVDGAAGRLVMRGHSLDEFAGHTSFEEMAALMLDGFVPDLPAMKDLPAALGAARQELFETVVRKAVIPATLGPVEMIRAMTALVPDGEDAGTGGLGPRQGDGAGEEGVVGPGRGDVLAGGCERGAPVVAWDGLDALADGEGVLAAPEGGDPVADAQQVDAHRGGIELVARRRVVEPVGTDRRGDVGGDGPRAEEQAAGIVGGEGEGRGDLGDGHGGTFAK